MDSVPVSDGLGLDKNGNRTVKKYKDTKTRQLYLQYCFVENKI